MAYKTYKPTKADLMRAYIAQCRAEGRTTRPIEIMAEMKKKGIEISSGQASVVLRKFNKRRRQPRAANKLSKHVNGVSTNSAVNGGCATTKTFNDSLLKASQFARSCGGIAQAKKMLGELEQIVDPFIRS